MSGANGRVGPRSVAVAEVAPTASALEIPSIMPGFQSEKIRLFVAELEVPFDSSAIEWRVTRAAKQAKRGQIAPYADPRAYTDRLNALFTPAGWTRKYTVHTSASFERAKDKRIVTKVFVTCELTIFGLGTHSATGEEWADNESAGTAAEAQSFKRAATCFGLGRYLYYFTRVWVDLDEKSRPRNIPQLFDWATPQGWREGKRPSEGDWSGSGTEDTFDNERVIALVHEIEAMADTVGKPLYRSVLKRVARVWNPNEIREAAILQTVLNEMRAADAELRLGQRTQLG